MWATSTGRILRGRPTACRVVACGGNLVSSTSSALRQASSVGKPRMVILGTGWGGFRLGEFVFVIQPMLLL